MQITPRNNNDDNTVMQIICDLSDAGATHLDFVSALDKSEITINFSCDGKRHKIKVRTDLPEYRIIELVNEEIKALQLLREISCPLTSQITPS